MLLRTVSIALVTILLGNAQGSAQQRLWTIGLDVGRTHIGATSRDATSGDDRFGRREILDEPTLGEGAEGEVSVVLDFRDVSPHPIDTKRSSHWWQHVDKGIVACSRLVDEHMLAGSSLGFCV